MRRILLNCFIVALFFVLSFSTGHALAQTSQKSPEEIAKEKGITFPIAELGDCKNFNECRTFCDDPVNRDTCIAFAKKKGFYKEPQQNVQKSEIIKAAKSELGCNSEDSCSSFCSKEENHDKCSNFAKSHNLGGGQTSDPSKAQVLEKAKTILGCSSYETCKNFCENEANREKCSNFAKQAGLRGGEQKVGPGGCTSEETCRKFCSDPSNFEICQKFQSSVTGNSQSFHGPGGCTTPESCKTYCEKNPQDCQNLGGATNLNPAEVCSKTPNCSWNGSTCQCQGFNPQSGTTSGTINNKEDYCHQFPERCGIQNSPYPNYSPNPSGLIYPKYSPYPYPSGLNNPGLPYQYPSPSNYPSGLIYPSQSPSSPIPTPFSINSNLATPAPGAPVTTSATKEQCAQGPGCSWNGTSCICQAVQGASTVQPTFFQNLLQFLFRL